MRGAWKAVTAVLALQTLSAAYAFAQPWQMTADWHMPWPMVAVCVLVVIDLLLGAAALIKYLFFR
jgi:hypothetical protein